MEWGRYASSIIILKRKKISYDRLLCKEMTEGRSALHESCVVVLLWCDGLWFSESPLVILWLSALSKCRLGRWKEGEKRFTRLMRLGGPHRVWLRTGCLWGLRRTQRRLWTQSNSLRDISPSTDLPQALGMQPELNSCCSGDRIFISHISSGGQIVPPHALSRACLCSIWTIW